MMPCFDISINSPATYIAGGEGGERSGGIYSEPCARYVKCRNAEIVDGNHV